MKHLTVALLTGSPIIDAGLRVLLGRLNDRGVDIVTISHANMRDDIVAIRPSLLIVSPTMLTTMSVNEIRRLTDRQMPIVLITGGQTPEVAMREFNAVITLYDSHEQIVDKLRGVVSDNTDDTAKEISPREREVIIGIVKGLSNKEIANEINVSVNTVMTHRRNIARKLSIHSPAALTVYAIVKKMVKIDDIKGVINNNL